MYISLMEIRQQFSRILLIMINKINVIPNKAKILQ